MHFWCRHSKFPANPVWFTVKNASTSMPFCWEPGLFKKYQAACTSRYHLWCLFSFPFCYVYLQRPVSTVRASILLSNQMHDTERGGGGKWVKLFYCTYIFCLFFMSDLKRKKSVITVINRQQVVLFCLNNNNNTKKQNKIWTNTKKRSIKLQPKPGCNNNINNHQHEYSQKQQPFITTQAENNNINLYMYLYI